MFVRCSAAQEGNCGAFVILGENPVSPWIYYHSDSEVRVQPKQLGHIGAIREWDDHVRLHRWNFDVWRKHFEQYPALTDSNSREGIRDIPKNDESIDSAYAALSEIYRDARFRVFDTPPTRSMFENMKVNGISVDDLSKPLLVPLALMTKTYFKDVYCLHRGPLVDTRNGPQFLWAHIQPIKAGTLRVSVNYSAVTVLRKGQVLFSLEKEPRSDVFSSTVPADLDVKYGISVKDIEAAIKKLIENIHADYDYPTLTIQE